MSLKVPLIAVPEPSLLLEKIDPQDEDKVEATFQALVRLLNLFWIMHPLFNIFK